MFNPASGSGRAERWARWAGSRLEEEGEAFALASTSKEGNLHSLDGREVSVDPSHWKECWVVGGDGTLHQLVGRFDQGFCPIAILPCGTGNVVARDLGIPLRRAAAFRAIRAGRVVPYDLGKCNGRRFTFMVSAGLDALAVHQFHRWRQKCKGLPRIAYLLAALSQAEVERRGDRFQLKVDGVPLGGVSYVAILNARHYAGGFILSPQADPFDGRLTVVYLRDPIAARPLRVVHAFLRKSLPRLPDAGCLDARSVRVDGVQFVQIDGEPWQASSLECHIEKGALPMRASLECARRIASMEANSPRDC